MNAKMKLSDFDHPVVQAKAKELIKPGGKLFEIKSLNSEFQIKPIE